MHVELPAQSENCRSLAHSFSFVAIKGCLIQQYRHLPMRG